jgi:2-polyprenyl-3-methyl-5-hydroxy-6-metoxy-1,4-benzoquinol methylase
MKLAMPTAQNKIRTAARSRCLFCDSQGVLLYQDLADGLFDVPGLWNIRKCPRDGCEMLWLDPSPVQEDLHIAYENYFTHVSTGMPSFVPRLREWLYGCYKGANSWLAAIVGLSESQKQIRLMFLGDLKCGRVLDVGCGDGGFLHLMSKAGWSVEGLDFDPKAIESAKVKYGLELRHGDLPSAGFQEGAFDAVTMSHVIEHVPDPVSLLAEARRVLKPGGRLVVTTPNSRSLGHEKFGRFWIGLDAPRHLNIFNLPALRECARRAGFDQIEVSSTAARADIILGGSYAIRRFHRHHDRPQINILRSAMCVWLQLREFAALKNNKERGEEAALICVKSGHETAGRS